MLIFFAWDGGWFAIAAVALILGLVGGFFGARSLGSGISMRGGSGRRDVLS